MSSKQAKSNIERRQFWQMVIETWQASGMSVSNFCKAEGLSQGAFYSWRKRLSGRHSQRKEQSSSSPPFIEVAMPRPAPSNSSGQALSQSNGNNHAALELLLSSGNTLRISSEADSKTLSNVISVLRQAGLC
jgi:transposase